MLFQTPCWDSLTWETRCKLPMSPKGLTGAVTGGRQIKCRKADSSSNLNPNSQPRTKFEPNIFTFIFFLFFFFFIQHWYVCMPSQVAFQFMRIFSRCTSDSEGLKLAWCEGLMGSQLVGRHQYAMMLNFVLCKEVVKTVSLLCEGAAARRPGTIQSDSLQMNHEDQIINFLQD